MSPVHLIELRCEIDPRHESIHGQMSDRQGNSLSFSGWSEFAGALMRLAGGDPEPSNPTDRSSEKR